MRAESIGFAKRTGVAAARRDLREDDRRILEASARYRARLAHFIRRRVPDPREAEDILQEVFYELVAPYPLFQPVEKAGALALSVGPQPLPPSFPQHKAPPPPH